MAWGRTRGSRCCTAVHSTIWWTYWHIPWPHPTKYYSGSDKEPWSHEKHKGLHQWCSHVSQHTNTWHPWTHSAGTITTTLVEPTHQSHGQSTKPLQMLWHNSQLATQQTWNSMTSISNLDWHKNYLVQHRTHRPNTHSKTIQRNTVLRSLPRTWWHNKHHGNPVLEKDSPLHACTLKDPHVVMRGRCHIPIMFYPSTGIPITSNLAFRKVHWLNSLTIHIDDTKQDGIPSNPPLQHGLCTKKHGRGWTMPPHLWTNNATNHDTNPTSVGQLTAWAHPGNPYPRIPALGRNWHTCSDRYWTLSLDPWPLAILHSKSNAHTWSYYSIQFLDDPTPTH